MATVPVQLFCFDLLELEGENTMTQQYVERRDRLGELRLTARGVQVPPYWTQMSVQTMLDPAASHALEGIL
ncbi:hypothetical protein OG563_48015 [Nocardia vinacea]|uniref:ATP-dependent DNA ligase family profile domain-containing protein n=1 Tax=Nocardia vinacea TaxID=96468 RepID=A0ABZ1YTW3_9NOCA|nr:hypothetical protein [Nocardia vinacea]